MNFKNTFPTFYSWIKYAGKNTIFEIYKEKLFYPFLIAVYPVLFLYSMNWQCVSFYEVTLPLVWILAVIFILFSFVNLFIRDGLKSAVLISFFLIIFFSYGHFYEVLKPCRFFGHRLDHGVLLGSCLIIYIIFMGIVFAMPAVREYLNRYLWIFSVLLIVLMSFRFVRAVISDIQEYTTTYKNNKVIDLKNGFKAAGTADYPDIYYIILDAYSSARALKKFYNYNNSGFVSWLKQKGFVLPQKTWSNYCQTALSLPSSLNMNYIDDIAEIIDRKTNSDLSPMKQLMARSAVAKFLKSRGYTVVKFIFGYTITDSFKADVTEQAENAFFLHEFTNQLASTTMLISMKTFFESELGMGIIVRRIMSMLEGLPVVAVKVKSPKFVFAHIICPHPPFVFDKNGPTDKFRDVDISPDDGSKFEATKNYYKQGYLAQIEFLNIHIKTVIEKIIRRSKRPPVIILQADHGSGMTYFTDIEKTNLPDRFSILNAYYLPDGGDKILYEGITPVNTFRMILNYYFGTNLQKLPDKNYFTSGNKPYIFTEITGKLKEYDNNIPK